ncbi:MAG TPA: type II toxin-antitoxin system RelE/ParE family toxin [Chitinophagales bacterium]|nr:type II toxin-antitoxin system RelE/ParE family toxin [Chitinophagales bacterium]HQO31740.1 type II toxin-antitoxin system RelE/ParE family toxin [Chitinophagales bacterium]
MRIEIQEEARIELREALIWYDEQQDGLAADLLFEIRKSISEIIKYPTRNKITFNQRREAFVNRFPYKIVYTIENNSIIVIYAFFHSSRNPKIKFVR